MAGNPEIASKEQSPSQKDYRFSDLDQLKKALKDLGWEDNKIRRHFFQSDRVQQKFPERTLTKAELEDFANKLEGTDTEYEKEELLRQIGELKGEIGDTITFGNLSDLKRALKERGAKYPEDYLEQPGSSFVASFGVSRTLTKTDYDALVTKLLGMSTSADRDRGEVIRAAFNVGEKPHTIPKNSAIPPSENANPKSVDPKVAESETQSAIEKALDKQILTVSVFKQELKEGQEAVVKLKEKFPEYTEQIDGIFGSTLLLRLANGGFSAQFDKNMNVQIVGSNPQAAQEIGTNINNIPGLNRTLARGMLYQSSITESFVRASTDADGKPTTDMSMGTFSQYADTYRKNNGQNLSAQDKALLDSLPAITSLLGNANATDIFRSYAESKKAVDTVMKMPTIQNQNTANASNSSVAGDSGSSLSGEKKVNAPAGFLEQFGSAAGKLGGGIAGMNVDFVKGAWEQHPIAGIVTLIGSLFAWKHFFTDEFDVPGLGKTKGWKIFLGAVTGSAAAMTAWSTIFGGNTERPTVTTAGVEVANLAANGLTEEHEKYGGLIEKISGANFLALKNWAQGAKGAPVPPEVQKVLDEEKDDTTRGEKEQFLKKYILSLTDSKIPAVSGKMSLLLSSAGADKMTLGELKNALYDGMKDQVEALKNALRAVIKDPNASPEDRAKAQQMLDEIESAQKKGDHSTLMWLSCLGILIAAGYVTFKVLLKGILYGKIAKPLVESIADFVRGKQANDAMRKTSWQGIKSWRPWGQKTPSGVEVPTTDGPHVGTETSPRSVEGELVDTPRTQGEVPSQAKTFDDLAHEISTVDGVDSAKIQELRRDIQAFSELEKKAIKGGGLDPTDLATKTDLEKKIGSAFGELSENAAVAAKIETHINSLEDRLSGALVKNDGALARTLKSQLEHLKSLSKLEGIGAKIIAILRKFK